MEDRAVVDQIVRRPAALHGRSRGRGGVCEGGRGERGDRPGHAGREGVPVGEQPAEDAGGIRWTQFARVGAPETGDQLRQDEVVEVRLGQRVVRA